MGIVWAPGDRKTVVRASFGLYYDRIPLRATSNALQRDGSKFLVVQLSPSQSGAPAFPNVLALQPATLPTKPNITRIDPNIELSYSQQANLQVERELPGNAIVSVGYLHLRAFHVILSRNVNVPTVAASAGIPNLGRPDPNWGNISRFESSGRSNYDGMVVSFNKRASRWGNVRVSYTLSKTIDDAGNFFFSSVQDNFNIRDDRGLSDNDQPLGVGRNTGRGFDYTSLDLRLSRKFRLTERVDLQLLAEGFNVLNRSNFGVPNNTFGSGATPLRTFGQPTSAFDPRQFQFGMRLSFSCVFIFCAFLWLQSLSADASKP